MRQCGECEVCCEIAEVKEDDFFKPAFQKCPHQCGGCAIYGKLQRPGICNAYQCSWLRGFGIEEDRPDKNSIMVSINRIDNFDFVTVIETEKNSAMTSGKDMIVDIVTKINLPAIIFDCESSPPKTGDRLVIHKNIEHRCGGMMGDFIEKLNDEITMYKLVKTENN